MSFALIQLTTPTYASQIKTTQDILSGSFELMGDNFALEHLHRQNKVNFI